MNKLELIIFDKINHSVYIAVGRRRSLVLRKCEYDGEE
jgi:hypothetical protein